jgi:hypothetical protein
MLGKTAVARQRVTTIRRAMCFLLAQAQGYIGRHSDVHDRQTVRKSYSKTSPKAY